MDKILSNLGLCYKARGLITGEDFVCEGLANKTIFLIFLATDASENAKKKIRNKAQFYNIEVIEEYTSSELSHSVGKEGRMVVGITNKGFVKILKK